MPSNSRYTTRLAEDLLGAALIFNTEFESLLAFHLRKNPKILGVIVRVSGVWEANCTGPFSALNCSAFLHGVQVDSRVGGSE